MAIAGIVLVKRGESLDIGKNTLAYHRKWHCCAFLSLFSFEATTVQGILPAG